MPRALVSLEKIYYMNRWGEIFKAVTILEDMDYPVITGIEKNDVQIESKLKLASHVLDSLETETGPWSIKELSEINISKNGDVSLYSTSLTAVVMINGVEVGEKKDDLKKVVNHLRRKGLIHTVKKIDMNYNSGAVVSFIKS
jgi:cell division protein FtsQ